MNKKLLHKIFLKYPVVKLVYFFGSRSQNTDGPLSDYDFAVYFDTSSIYCMHNTRMELLADMTRALNTDHIDIVVLNTAKGSDLKFNIINEGTLIYEQEPYKIILEPQIMNEYFDYRAMMLRHGLTRE